MEHVSKPIVVNLITTPEELSKLFKGMIDESMNKYKIANQANEKKEELLTIQQIADYFQVSITTIHNWKKEGLIPYVKVKSRVRFKKSVVLDLEEKRRKRYKYL